MNTPFFLFPLDFVLLKLLGKLLFLLLFHVTMQMFGGIAESRRHQDFSVLTQFISDPDEELLQLHSIFKDLRICPAGSKWYNKTKAFFSYSKPITSMHKNMISRRFVQESQQHITYSIVWLFPALQTCGPGTHPVSYTSLDPH